MLEYTPRTRGRHPPPGTRGRHPPGTRGRHPSGTRGRHPPRNQRQTPLWDQRQTSPGRHLPYRHTPQCMLGTHPTGMHLCLKFLPPAKEVAGSYNVFIRVFLSVSSQGTSHVTITHDALHLTIKETPPPHPCKGPWSPPRTGTPLALAPQKSSNLSNLDFTAQGPLSPCYVQTCSTWTSL